jgi:LPS O-antigen subunit length determinant protein (WzzB/FepE family)
MNPLYQQMSNNGAGMQNLAKQFQQFKQNFSGNPQKQVQQLLNSGKVTQEQYNQAVQKAQLLQQFLK